MSSPRRARPPVDAGELEATADGVASRQSRRLSGVAAEAARAEKLRDVAELEAAMARERAANREKAYAAASAARAERLLELKHMDDDARREREANVRRARRASSAEQAARVAEHGTAPRPTAAATLGVELEARANTVLVRGLADREQESRVLAALEAALAQEAERAANARAADAAADEERSRRVDEGPVDIGAAMTNAALRESLPGAAAKMEKKVEARVAPKDEATRDAPAADAACGCAVA